MSKDKVPDKRERILNAALLVFAEHGFYNAKVSQVARAAGVADGTIYLYFQNKDDLLISLFEDRMEWLIRRLDEGLANAGGDVPTRLRRLIQEHLRLAAENPALAEFITVELRQSSKFVKEYGNPKFQEYLKILRDLIEEGQKEGTIRAHLDARMVVRAIFGALDEMLLTLTLASRRHAVDTERAGNDLADLFLAGIQTQGAEGTSSAAQ